MHTYALLNIYEDRTFLGACLESIKNCVDEIIVADGAYELYYQRYKVFTPEAQPSSTDGSMEILKGFRGLPKLTILPMPTSKEGVADKDGKTEGSHEVPWANQAVKRTALIDAVPVGDWFLIIDADEMLAGDFQEGLEHTLDSGCIVGNCPLYNPGTQMERLIRNWHPRLFKKVEGMRYYGTHWHLRDKYERIIEEMYPMFWTDIYAIVHFKPFKDQTRLIPHSNYMVDLMSRGWIEPRDIDDVLLTIKSDGTRDGIVGR